jgi:hypothetical protein
LRELEGPWPLQKILLKKPKERQQQLQLQKQGYKARKKTRDLGDKKRNEKKQEHQEV